MANSMQSESLLIDESVRLPHSLEAEQSVLGAILLDQGCISVVLEYIRSDSFYLRQHQQVFSLIISMFSSGRSIDYITVLNEAVSAKIFDSEQAAKVYLCGKEQKDYDVRFFAVAVYLDESDRVEKTEIIEDIFV